MGRQLIHDTPEKQAAATKAWRAKSREKSRNVTLDLDAIDALAAYKEKLAEELGFTPSLSQTLKVLIRRATNG